MSILPKTKKILTEVFSSIILIPLLIICICVLFLVSGFIYEFAIMFFASAIIGGAVLFIVKCLLLVLFWITGANKQEIFH